MGSRAEPWWSARQSLANGSAGLVSNAEPNVAVSQSGQSRVLAGEHRRAGGIQTADRFGELRRFGFLTLSIAILDTGAESYTSAAQMAERLQVVKSRAKAVPGNCLLYATPDGVRDLLSDAALPGVDGLMAANL